ncbi:hypothetical protein [Polyangium jinanense]|uniref:Uncharacterized protein n=1 Tax=Polyangium jinanense TaxID=2829994 RepID=A0A9X3XFI8_9BACT|nr:hypothetical protein [Polyangium jinanense]MDC3989342.1 hypothetical protein [Polyangium jinanense]
MDAQSLLDRLRNDDDADEKKTAKSALSDNPDLPAELLAWAARAVNEEVAIERADASTFLAVSLVVTDPALKGRLRFAQAELMHVSSDSDQYVLDAAIDAVGWAPDLAGAYELIFDKLRGSSDLDWTEAFEKIGGRGLPKDALALLRHVIERTEAGVRTGDKPYFLKFAPTEGATLADVEAFVAQGLLAEAVAARRGAAGEDFPTARRAILGG